MGPLRGTVRPGLRYVGGARAAVFGTGVLLAMSFPPFALVLVPFIALVPLLLFIAELPPGVAGRWSALRAGYGVGILSLGLLLYWIVTALWGRTAMAVPAFVLVVGALAAFTAGFGAALHYVTERTRVRLPLAAAILWTGTEWLQAHLGELSFPWLRLGASLAAFPRLAGAADLVGVGGLTFWIVLVSGLIAQSVLEVRQGRSVRGLAVGMLIVVALPIVYGVWRAERLELIPAAHIAFVQPNISQDLKARGPEAIDSTRAAVRSLIGSIPAGSVDLIALPEVAFPTALENPLERRLVDALAALSATAKAPLLVGAYGTSARARAHGFTNASFIVDGQGLTGDRYDKRHLVPFIEHLPFVPYGLGQRLPGGAAFGQLLPGTSAPVFGEMGARYGVLICFESAFGRHARRFRRSGADVLINMTNDAWFGGEGRISRTSALWQHPAHATLRAIELRVGVVRAANTGISMIVDPIGRVHERTELFAPDARAAIVHTTAGLTLYALWGDWLARGAALASLLLLVIGRVDRDR